MTDLQDRLWIAPNVQWGEPCVGGTRVPAVQMARCWWYGTWTETDLLDDYRITRNSLVLCCWWAALHCRERWLTGSGWKEWARQWETTLWEGRWSGVVLPPQKGARA